MALEDDPVKNPASAKRATDLCPLTEALDDIQAEFQSLPKSEVAYTTFCRFLCECVERLDKACQLPAVFLVTPDTDDIPEQASGAYIGVRWAKEGVTCQFRLEPDRQGKSVYLFTYDQREEQSVYAMVMTEPDQMSLLTSLVVTHLRARSFEVTK